MLEICEVIFGLTVPHGNQILFFFPFGLKLGIYCVVYFLFNFHLFLFKGVSFRLAERHTQPHKAVGIFNI